jgi:alpha-1,3(6)-mannosylglycoprotein beta-1,6-N-acetyl-glucosaminyltransferase
MKLAWIKARITSMWPNWQKSANILATKLNSGLVNTPVKKVLLHLGLISDNAGFKIAETAFHGGPLGELVQWADLIASLYLLGHKLTISYEIQHLQGCVSVMFSMYMCMFVFLHAKLGICMCIWPW